MNLSGKLSAPKPSLNPNAAEFVPSSLRVPVAGLTSPDANSKFANTTPTIPGKAVLDRSESSVSNNSDEEAQQYWRHQLPDDITPDFKVMGTEDAHGINGLSFSNLSLADVNETSRYSASMGGNFMLKEQQGYPMSSYGDFLSPRDFQPKPWDKQIMRNDQLLGSEPPYNGNSGHFLPDMTNEQLMDNPDVSPLEFLAAQFPGFAADSLAEVYFANGCDIHLTIEMLTQLEVVYFCSVDFFT